MGLNTLLAGDQPANDTASAVVPPSKDEIAAIAETEALRQIGKELANRRGAIASRQHEIDTETERLGPFLEPGDDAGAQKLSQLRGEAARLRNEQDEITRAMKSNARALADAEQRQKIAARDRIRIEQELRLDRRLVLAREIDNLSRRMVACIAEMDELGRAAHLHVLNHVSPLPQLYSIMGEIREDKFHVRLWGALIDHGLPLGDDAPSGRPRTLEDREREAARHAALTEDLRIVAFVDNQLQPPPRAA